MKDIWLHNFRQEHVTEPSNTKKTRPCENVTNYHPQPEPRKYNVKLCELEGKVDDLFNLALTMKYSIDIERMVQNTSKSVYIFNMKFPLLIMELEQFAERNEYDFLWESATYAIDKFIAIPHDFRSFVKDFLDQLISYFMKAVQANVKSHASILNTIMTWESKQNCNYDALSDILVQLPDEVMEAWAVHALERWKKYPVSELGVHSNSSDERKFTEKHLQAWAEKHNDDSLKLEILEKKKYFSCDVVELVLEYRRQGIKGKSLPILLSAHKLFSYSDDIIDLLVDELIEAGDHDKALSYAWKNFTEKFLEVRPVERLHAATSKLECWPKYFTKILSHLKKEGKKIRHSAGGHTYSYNFGTTLRRVEITFEYGDKQQAWQLALKHNVTVPCWIKLTDWRITEAPDEVIAVLQKQVDRELLNPGELPCDNAIELLLAYRRYAKMLHCEQEFAEYCATLRQKNRRRWVLTKKMNAENL